MCSSCERNRSRTLTSCLVRFQTAVGFVFIISLLYCCVVFVALLAIVFTAATVDCSLITVGYTNASAAECEAWTLPCLAVAVEYRSPVNGREKSLAQLYAVGGRQNGSVS